MASEATKSAYMTLGLLGESRPDDQVRAIFLEAITKIAALPTTAKVSDPEIADLRREISKRVQNGTTYLDISQQCGLDRKTIKRFVDGNGHQTLSPTIDALRQWLDSLDGDETEAP